MKLECVMTCVNYADFLEHTLPENVMHFDRVVVVTHPHDKATQQICSKYGVECIATEVFHEHGDKFNKGRAINLGLAHLRHDGWIVHLDADIVLPRNFRTMLQHCHLHEDNLYGADRLNTGSYENWMTHKHKTHPQHQWRFLVSPNQEFPLGARLMHQEFGYCPIGYFQMWHSKTHRRYPVVSGSAEHSDVVFALQWPKQHRVLLPEFFVYHLESEQAEMGKNWQGRRTAPFGPKKHHNHHDRKEEHWREHKLHKPKEYCK